ncbi:ABC transporter permease [Limosilactobacillus oris]|uniref:ABC transporter permease n=1 Tax=Limosilactobacillus oris TaxID=1632 RepID=UPI0026DC6A6D|nr:ABC transporter permease [Limosilactobacillus oris]
MRTLAITKRILKELLRDRRTLALMFLAPILIMWLMNVMFSANSKTDVEIATVNVSQTIRHNLAQVDGVTVTPTKTVRQAEDKLKSDHVDAVIEYQQKANRFNVTYANTDSSKTALTKQALKAAITGQTITTLSTGVQQLQSVIKATNPSFSAPQQSNKAPSISNHYQYGNADTGFFAKIVKCLIIVRQKF